MQDFTWLSDKAHEHLDACTKTRDQVLAQARTLTRHAAHAIRAIHRDETALARENLEKARNLVISLKASLGQFPELYYAGYSQDAIKEYVEACLTLAFIKDEDLPMPEDLGVEYATYLNGLAEAATELRRRCLDILRQGYSQEAERLLGCMDEVYTLLVTLDYPDAVTGGLRRQTDLLRGVLERTRGDLTTSLREYHLQQVMSRLLDRLEMGENSLADDQSV